MLIQQRFLLPVLLSMLCVLGISQDRFDRLYMMEDTTSVVMTRGQQAPGMSFNLLGVKQSESEVEASLNVTRLKPKGDLAWSFNYGLDEGMGVGVFNDLHTFDDGSFVIAATAADIALNSNKYLAKFTANAELEWAKVLGGVERDSSANASIFVEAIGDQLALISVASGNDLEDFDIYASMHDLAGTTLWSKTFSHEEDGVDIPLIVGETSSLDTNFIIAGIRDSIDIQAFLTSIDTSGNIQWGFRYFDTTGTINLGPLAMTTTQDGGYVHGGILQDNSFGSLDGYVSKVDSSGTPVWNRRVQLSLFAVTYIVDLIELDNGNILIQGGSLVDFSLNPSSLSYFMEFDPNGNLVRQYFNSSQLRLLGLDLLEIGDLHPTPEGGATFITNDFDPNELVLIPELMKIDVNGSYSCEDTIVGDFVAPFDIVKDTLVLSSIDVVNEDTLNMERSVFNDYQLPELILDDIAFCPGVPIDTILDAMVSGIVDTMNVSYEWNTGDTTRQIRVTEEGDYIVNVRIEEFVCYNLCDTGRISVYDEPMASISLGNGPLCVDGSLDLGVSIMAEAPIDSIIWSTGEMTTIINITEPGNYGVEVFDICDQRASANLNVSEEEFFQPVTVSITTNAGTCQNGGTSITANVSGDVQSILWNTGETSPTIFAAPGQLYNVIVTDICQGTTEASITINAEEISVTAIKGLDTCADGNILLTASTQNGVLSATWTNTEGIEVGNAPAITITESSTYTVDVIDQCGFQDTASVSVSNLELFECGADFFVPCEEDNTDSGCLCFPRAFVPSSMVEENQDFGPYDRCGVVENYELKIYNRWGQLVFETTSLDNEWDGNHDGEPAPPDVYIYQAKYSVPSVQLDFETTGDITLIR